MAVIQAFTMKQLSAPFPTRPMAALELLARARMGIGHCGQERLYCGSAVADRGWLLHLHQSFRRRDKRRSQTLRMDRRPKTGPRRCQTWEANVRVGPLGPTIAEEFESLFDKIEREDIDDFLINQRTSSFFEHRKPLTFFPGSHREPSSDRAQLSRRLPQFDVGKPSGPRCCGSALLTFELSQQQFP